MILTANLGFFYYKMIAHFILLQFFFFRTNRKKERSLAKINRCQINISLKYIQINLEMGFAS